MFRKSGRNLELTEDGHGPWATLTRCSRWCQLEAAVRQARDGQRVLDFKVGGRSGHQSIAHRLLEPALSGG
ncbi:hypothetical protein [Candidatus Aalborgicola defluviihabitans]|uniref:hypothetical protein n=1 Tax=Candidatus Aalborgicola defluviihabitans TaxID=3386187 RepID=UPI0039B885DC